MSRLVALLALVMALFLIASHADEATVVIVVRHAEMPTDDPRDPNPWRP